MLGFLIPMNPEKPVRSEFWRKLENDGTERVVGSIGKCLTAKLGSPPRRAYRQEMGRREIVAIGIAHAFVH
jgi:hypothetical protein